MKICPTCNQEFPDDMRFCQNDGTTLRSPSGADLIGSVIADRYHIIQKLGEGGMGAVYLGEHVKMHRLSAIKVMHQAMADDADAIARFNREAANAARINHPNVCGIYDFGETADGLIYLAMEFIEGKALTDLLDVEGTLPPKRAAEILRQTAEALQAAHELGIVHRDLKPDNIMIVAGRDQSDTVKVVDFGIAKAMGSGSQQKVTKTGLVVGTPEYMSPEQLSGDTLDARSDIYSLGLVLFRMLTGQLPFAADTAQEVMIMRLTDDPKTLAQAVPGATFPDRLQRALDRALRRMPSDRYASASSFGRDVTAAVSTMPDASSPVDETRPLGRPLAATPGDEGMTADVPDTQMSVRPSKARTLAASDTPPGPEPATAPAGRSEDDSSAAPRRPVSPRRTSSKIMAAVAGVILAGGVGGAVFVVTGNGDGPDDNRELVAKGRDSVTPTTPLDTSGAKISDGHGDSGVIRTRDTGRVDPGFGNDTTGGSPDLGDSAGTDRGRRVPAGPTVGSAEADQILVALLIRMEDEDPSRIALGSIRDSAVAFFDETAYPDAVRATAAFVVANAWAKLDDRTRALEWAMSARRLAPNDESYRQLVIDLGGNPE